MVVAGLYYSGFQALQAQSDQIILNSRLRSRMEWLLSVEFDQLANGSETFTVNATSYTLTWTVTGADLDGDLTPEAEAKQIALAVAGNTLNCIVVDNESRIGKF